LTYPNLFALGTLAADEVSSYVDGATACLVAYDFRERPPPPLKVLDYLARTRPVISSIPIEYDELDGKGIYYAPDVDHYLALIGSVLAGEVEPDSSAVERFLENRTYEAAIEKIFEALS
jgi:hypothetical protein